MWLLAEGLIAFIAATVVRCACDLIGIVSLVGFTKRNYQRRAVVVSRHYV